MAAYRLWFQDFLCRQVGTVRCSELKICFFLVLFQKIVTLFKKCSWQRVSFWLNYYKRMRYDGLFWNWPWPRVSMPALSHNSWYCWPQMCFLSDLLCLLPLPWPVNRACLCANRACWNVSCDLWPLSKALESSWVCVWSLSLLSKSL